jgi:hypothetical protein
LHPLFWDDEKKLNFLLAVSDRLENEDECGEARLSVECKADKVVGRGWDKKLDPDLLNETTKYRKYNSNSLRDLLRMLRNKHNHFHSLTPELQAKLGPLPSGYLKYFTSRFPELFMRLYVVMACFLHEADTACLVNIGPISDGSKPGLNSNAKQKDKHRDKKEDKNAETKCEFDAANVPRIAFDAIMSSEDLHRATSLALMAKLRNGSNVSPSSSAVGPQVQLRINPVFAKYYDRLSDKRIKQVFCWKVRKWLRCVRFALICSYNSGARRGSGRGLRILRIGPRHRDQGTRIEYFFVLCTNHCAFVKSS